MTEYIPLGEPFKELYQELMAEANGLAAQKLGVMRAAMRVLQLPAGEWRFNEDSLTFSRELPNETAEVPPPSEQTTE